MMSPRRGETAPKMGHPVWRWLEKQIPPLPTSRASSLAGDPGFGLDDGLGGRLAGEGGQGFFEGGGVFHVEGGLGAVDLAEEAGEDAAGADFYEGRGVFLKEKLDAFHPADGGGDLADEAVAGVGGADDAAGVDVDDDRVGGVLEGEGFEVGGEALLGGLHEGAVEGGRDLEHDGALGAGCFAKFGGAGDGGGGSGDDGLVGGIEVGGGDDGAGGAGGVGDADGRVGGVGGDGLGVGGFGEGGFGVGVGGVGGGVGVDIGFDFAGELVHGLAAEVVDLVGGEAEDGGHGALAGGDGLLHVTAAVTNDANGVGEGEGAGDDVGGVLAEGVAGGEGGGGAGVFQALFKDAGGGDGDSEDGGLGVLRLFEVVFGAFEDELGEGKAEGVVGLFKDGAGDGKVVEEVAAHADGLRALAGKEKGWFH